MPEDRKHHSTEQPRAQGGQWRQPAGTFDHAGKVPPSPPRYGEMPDPQERWPGWPLRERSQ